MTLVDSIHITSYRSLRANVFTPVHNSTDDSVESHPWCEINEGTSADPNDQVCVFVYYFLMYYNFTTNKLDDDYIA
jgi:hypothetical protein